ncbi:CBS domain-containing protein [Paenibacillus antri]|uniref:CBS domain-containing protein n=1 Tax=Paenibacillus antri TaxID=2582848 RepID=A0A5R9GGP1_9BACL|nr:nucleotidyltransferase family protein [Paenibacillus antri]TLS50575.1 CBS domain-containing protein [Paenibacillus antri]
MKSWTHALVSPDATMEETIRVIDRSSLQIALVVDEHRKLLGTVTDGDVRRAILRGVALHHSTEHIMNVSPVVAYRSTPKRRILELMKEKRIRHIPIVDDEGVLVSFAIFDELVEAVKRNNWVVLMAGGLGTRLRPLTEETPKPLLKVGTKPILETILESFVDQGFSKFFLSVNYKADMIQSYFGDGSKWGVEIHYIQETERLGTAGALSLLPEQPQEPLIVMNGDLLTKVNFQQLLEFHNEQESAGTMCVREYQFQVPYGVVRVEEHRMRAIEEKPLQKYFVNAGIYVLSPEAVRQVPKGTFYDMPNLFQSLMIEQQTTTVFPIREYWLDIGRLEEFDRANGEFQEVFGA